MDFKEKREGNIPYIEISGVEYFDVGKTFDCGQCFRFDKVENSRHSAEYAGVAHGRYVSFASDDGKLYIYNSDMRDFENVWRSFLSVDMDYAEINGDILSYSSGTVMDEAMEYGSGIRILKQEPYEALISFIVSQNNNIPRIKKIIESMSAKCGERINLADGMEKHDSGRSSMSAFPTCQALLELGESGLTELKTGFRAKYIYGAAEMLSNGAIDLSSLEADADLQTCIDGLCKIKGVGLKVASCAALFGLGKYDAFPIDVWMKKVAEKYFADDEQDFSSARFGKYAGIAQQYLFYYERYKNS